MRPRTKQEYECSCCGKKVLRRPIQVKHNTHFWCSKKCSSTLSKTGSYFPCGNKGCSKTIYRTLSSVKISKSGDVFCSRNCSTIVNNTRYKSGESNSRFKNGLRSYRRKALDFYGEKCSNISCPLTFNVEVKMLDVHHKDGNRKHNKLPNLEVLCVWCHALKTRSNLSEYSSA